MSFFVRVTLLIHTQSGYLKRLPLIKCVFFNKPENEEIKIKAFALFVIFYQQERTMFQPSANLLI